MPAGNLVEGKISRTHKQRQKITSKLRYHLYNVSRLDNVAYVCSSLCYGWTKVDVECLQGTGKVRTITWLWRHRVKCRYRATHYQFRPHFGVRIQNQEPTVLNPRMKKSIL